MPRNPEEEPDPIDVDPATAEAVDCPSCGEVALLVSSEYVCLERCYSCDHSRLLGWFSNEPLLLLAGKPRLQQPQVWMRQFTVHGGTS
jgi:hypothetical protein